MNFLKSTTVRIVFAALLVTLGLAPAASAVATTSTFEILLDLDNNQTTGCSVATLTGSFPGVEQILITTVTSGGPVTQVTAVQSQTCTNPGTNTFGPATAVPAPAGHSLPWTIGVGNGTGGTDVIETYLPISLAAYGPIHVVRIGVLAFDNGGVLRDEMLKAGPTPGNGPPILLNAAAAINDIPTLSDWGLMLLGLVLAVAAVALLRRRRTAVAFLIALLLLGMAGLAWAAVTCDLNGATTTEWIPGTQLGSETTSDAPVGTDLRAVFGFKDGTLGAPQGSLSFRIDAQLYPPVTNVTPVVDPATFSIPENSANATNVGTPITYTDPDAGQTHTFAITAGNTGGAFAIDPSTGQITVANSAALDFETTPVFNLTVQVTDNGSPAASGSATVTINLTDVNEAPVVNPATFAVAENATNGTSVGTVTFSDPDVGQTHTCAITAGNTGGAFAINAATCQITVADSTQLDFNTTPTYSLTVQVTDNGTPNLSGTATVTVNVTDANDPPVVNAATFSIPENSPNGTNVGTPVTFSDPDAGQTHTFAITAGNTGGAFAINSATGQITVATSAALDFETTPTFSLTVQVTDNGSPVLSGSATITVNLTDVNDPPVVNPVTFSIPENSPNSTNVGTPVTFTDQDTGQTHTFSITGGNTGGAFAIDPSTGQITVANSGALDFETTPTFSLTVQVTDNGTPALSGTATVTINLTDVNEAPVVNPATFSVPEHAPNGTAVGTPVTFTDPDAGQTHTFAITAGNTSGAFAINSATGQITVANSAALDFATNPTFSLTVQVTDNGTPALSGTATVTINLGDVNDPPVVNPATFSIPENSPNGTNVGTPVTFSDPDAGQTHTFAITAGNTAGAFAIDALTGQITVANSAALDFETTPSFSLTVQVTDNGSPVLAGAATVTVNLTNVDDSPVIDLDANDDKGTTGSDFAATYKEGDPAVLLEDPLDATLTDQDSANLASLTVTITNILDPGSEVLSADVTGTSITANYVPATGVLTLTGPDTVANFQTVLRKVQYQDTDIDPDTSAPRVIHFVANDGNSNSNTATSTVTDVAVDTPPTAVADSATVAEDSGATAIDVLANDTDPDNGPKSIASVTQPANGTVAITGGGTGLTYTPNANYCNTPPGTTLDTFTYTLSPAGSTPTATVTVTVSCVDDPPVAVADTATVTEDSGANAIDVLANDTDPDGGPKSVASVTQPANGTVAITGGGTGVSYTPNANYCNTPPGTTLETFTYTLTPGSSSTTVTVTVNCVDDPPVAVADAATVVEDSGANAINVLANDTDPDGGPKSIASVTQPANGTVAITGGGTGLTYTPNANYCNTPPGTTLETFTYTLTPGSSSTTVTVTVTCVDDDPVAVADAATVTEDSGANAINVLANDTDIDGGPKSVASVTQPANGTVAITGGGTGVSYTPNANYCNNPPGTTLETFTYTLTPGSSSTTVTVTVTCVDDPPVAVNDAATVTEDSGANAINVLANDTDIDGGSKSVASVTQPANGAVAITGGGTGVSYTPNANYCNNPPGTTLDTFTYTLTPGSSTATVTVTVTCVDDNPVAVADAATVVEDSGVNAINVLANDTDIDGGPKSVTSVTQPANGTVAITGGGTGVSYTPNANYCNNPPGTTLDTFTYTLTPGGSSTTVTVTVTCVDDPPVAVNDTATVTEDDPATAIPVLANDTDIDGGPKSISAVTQPANGAVVITGGGTGLTYKPNANYCNNPPGTFDTFTYTLTPGGSSATVSMTVICVNDPPVLANNPITYTTPGNTQLHVAGATLPGVASWTDAQDALTKASPSDIDGPGPIQVVAGSGSSANGGSFTIAADGSFSYVPPVGFSGTDSFTYVVTDNGAPAATTTGTINITVGQRVWYIRDVVDANNAAGGDGRSTNAFDSIAAFNAATTNNGDIIYVFEGNTGTTPLSGSITLKDGQKLWGQGINLDLTSSGFGNLVTATNRPRIRSTAASTPAVSVPATAGNRNNVEIRGLDFETTGATSNAIDVTSSGANVVGITIVNNNVRGATGKGINLSEGGTGAFTATLDNNALASTGNAFDATTAVGAGTLTISFSNNAVVSGATGININGSAGGTTWITNFANNAVSQNNIGTGVSITSAKFDATPGGSYQTVSGGTTVIGASGAGNGVNGSGMLLNNVSGDLAFTNLNIFADGGSGLSLTGTGAVNTGAGTGTRVTVGAGVGIIEAIGGPAVSATSATIDLQLSSLKSTNSSTTGVALNSVNGTFSAGSGSSISGLTSAAGTSFQVGNSNATISYAGTINAAIGTGVSLTNNTGSTIGFTGTLTLSTGGSPAFVATGGGTVTSSDTASTLTTTTATALNVANTTIGAGSLKFRRISSGTAGSGPTNGIILNNTGAGVLTVTGDGSTNSCKTGTTTCSGGTIQKSSGDGISITNAKVDLSLMWIKNNANSGIKGTTVPGFKLTDCLIQNNTNATGEQAGILVNDLSDSNSQVSRVEVSGSTEDNIRIHNSAVTGTITLSNCTVKDNSTASGNNGIFFQTNTSGNLTGTVQNSTLSGNRTIALSADSGDGSTLSATFSGNTITAGSPNQGNQGIQVSRASTSTLAFNINGNTVSGLISTLINVFSGSGPGTGTGDVKSNVCTGTGVGGNQFGIRVFNSGTSAVGQGTLNVNVANNTVSNIDNAYPIFGESSNSSGSGGLLKIAVTGNNASVVSGGTALDSIRVQARNTSTVCAKVSGNTTNSGGPGFYGIQLRQANTSTFNLEGLTLGAQVEPTVHNYLVAQNPGAATVSSDGTVTGTITGVSTGNCGITP